MTDLRSRNPDASLVDPTGRFTHRAGAYVKSRPSYPPALFDLLENECGLGPKTVVADLGSGTGIFTRPLLERGATVHAIEPNDDMRGEAERMLSGESRFHSVKGTAEATTLAPSSIDLVTSAQAFHWFDIAKTKAEIARILVDDGFVALVWNDRDLDGTPFLEDYEALLTKKFPGYLALQGKANNIAAFDAVFGAGRWTRRAVPNEQRLDREGLHARVMSASYAPREGEEAHRLLARALDDIFDRHAESGTVRITYACVAIFGRLARDA
jgi:SAM-dependent methyltransferase